MPVLFYFKELMMATRNNMLGKARFPKITRRRYSAPKELDASPEPPVRASDGGRPTTDPEISMSTEPKAAESQLAPYPENGFSRAERRSGPHLRVLAPRNRCSDSPLRKAFSAATAIANV